LVPRRVLAVGRRGDEAGGLEPLEALGKDVGRNVLGRGDKLAETLLAREQVANHEQRPAIAQQVEGTGDGAQRAPLRVWWGIAQSGAAGTSGHWPASHLQFTTDWRRLTSLVI